MIWKRDGLDVADSGGRIPESVTLVHEGEWVMYANYVNKVLIIPLWKYANETTLKDDIVMTESIITSCDFTVLINYFFFFNTVWCYI